jgi:thiamine biosynthesis lipoprotein
VHYHHILNPGTGRSAKKLISATILAPDSTTADALSTSIFIMGPEKGMKLVESLTGIEAVLIKPDGKLLYSEGLMQAKARKKAK